MSRVSIALLVALVSLAPVACDKGGGTAPPANQGSKYIVSSGSVPFFDSGCGQDRSPDGKIAKGMRFTLVSAEDNCWLVTLEDEVDTYVVPAGNIRAAAGS